VNHQVSECKLHPVVFRRVYLFEPITVGDLLSPTIMALSIERIATLCRNVLDSVIYRLYG
jgi:hypothetical protein